MRSVQSEIERDASIWINEIVAFKCKNECERAANNALVDISEHYLKKQMYSIILRDWFFYPF